MFPEITRDEVFRIETPRLWLRWPVLADAEALAAVVEQRRIDGGCCVAGIDPLRRLILAWRADMEVGAALHLVVTPKVGARRPIGILHTGETRGCVLDPHAALADEAAEALRTMVELLAPRQSTRPVPPMSHQRLVPPLELFAGCCVQA